MRDRYDIVIAGARCAGATLATYLARAGASVLVLDRDGLPSDQVLSTHTVHPPGMDVLDEVGVGPGVRSVAPPMRVMRLQKNEASVDVPFAEGRPEYCPRRHRLDGLLQDAAVAAGAELRDRSRVTGVLRRNDRVTGVRVTHPSGEYDVTASTVIGADGRHSTIAREVGAEEYLGYHGPRFVYWGYWPAPSCWHDKSAYPFDMYVSKKGTMFRVIFHTDHDHLLVASAPPISDIGAWRGNPERALIRDLQSDPVTAPLVEDRAPTDGVRGTLKERYFFRRAAGPGWALVGDAGHHKDFVIGDGITEALIQAKSIAAALAKGTDAALVEWWRARDVEALPLFFFAEDEGASRPPRKLEEVVFTHVARSPQLRARMADLPEHRGSPYETFPVSRLLQWTTAAALRGSVGVIGDFFTMGKRASSVGHELQLRRRLLAEAAAAAAQPRTRAGAGAI